MRQCDFVSRSLSKARTLLLSEGLWFESYLRSHELMKVLGNNFGGLFCFAETDH